MMAREEHLTALPAGVEAWDSSAYAALLPHPKADAHKYSRGHLRVIAGSELYPGAAMLCSSAAARSGAGYVSLAVPRPIVGLAQAHLVTVPVRGYQSSGGTFAAESVDTLLADAQKADAFLCGPGMTVTAGSCALLQRLLLFARKPLLLDADGLNALRECQEELVRRSHLGWPLVLTPHEGEACRILEFVAAMDGGTPGPGGDDHLDGQPEGAVDATIGSIGQPCESLQDGIAALLKAQRTLGWRVEVARVLSGLLSATVVFKGPVTIIAGEGRTVFSDHGTPALASAGTGDVLSGIIGALLAQGLAPLQAAALGVYLQGCAARIATRKVSDICMVATDVIDALGEAVLTLEQDGGR